MAVEEARVSHDLVLLTCAAGGAFMLVIPTLKARENV